MPPDPVLGFVAVTSYEPNPGPHWYEGPEALADEFGKETIALNILVQTATRSPTTNADLLLEGDVVESRRMYYSTDAQVDGVETSTEEL